MTTDQPPDQSYRLAPIEEAIARVARASTWCAQPFSSTVTAGLVYAAIIYTLLMLHAIPADPLLVESQQLGDPGAAMEQIRQDHFISLGELDELASDPQRSRFDQMALKHAPLFLDEGRRFGGTRRDDVPIGVYYTYSVSLYGGTELVHIEYWLYFSDENVGMSAANRIARWGHTLDRELIYRLNLLNGEIYGAEFQAPIHRLTPFTYPEIGRPVFRIASGNHNFQLVTKEEIESAVSPVELVVPRPQYELETQPLSDPDIMALAAQEALVQHEVNMSHYVYVAIRDPAYVLRDPFPARIDVGVLVHGNWRYLKDAVGFGIRVWGHRLVAIDVGVPVTPSDIEKVLLVTGSHDVSDRPDLYVSRVFVYPELRVPA